MIQNPIISSSEISFQKLNSLQQTSNTTEHNNQLESSTLKIIKIINPNNFIIKIKIQTKFQHGAKIKKIKFTKHSKKLKSKMMSIQGIFFPSYIPARKILTKHSHKKIFCLIHS